MTQGPWRRFIYVIPCILVIDTKICWCEEGKSIVALGDREIYEMFLIRLLIRGTKGFTNSTLSGGYSPIPLSECTASPFWYRHRHCPSSYLQSTTWVCCLYPCTLISSHIATHDCLCFLKFLSFITWLCLFSLMAPFIWISSLLEDLCNPIISYFLQIIS